MPLLKLVPRISLCVFLFACAAANVASIEAATPDKDLKRAEEVAAKLRRLEEASLSYDSGASRKAAKKIYPGIFASVADLRDGDIKSDLATAAALYETSYRIGATKGEAAPDCTRELRASYFQLCRESATRTQLLGAKARMHTLFAGAAILYARGDRSSTTLDTLAQLRAERASDLALAEEALRALKEINAEISDDSRAKAFERFASDGPTKQLSERVAATFGEVERILASLPRGHVQQLLRNTRDAFRDGLFWQSKTTPARALVVNVNSLDAPDPLRRIDVGADDADRAAQQNLRGALNFIFKAETAIAEARTSK